jgi:hypothetical protein
MGSTTVHDSAEDANVTCTSLCDGLTCIVHVVLVSGGG